jgi:hypothetical protein
MIPMRSAWVRLPAILLMTAALAGCDVLQAGASGSSRPVDAVHAQAKEALQRWAEAATRSGGATISFVGDQTGQIGDWEVAVGENNKQALMAGLVVAPTPLSDDKPDRGKVKWVGGDSIDVDVLSAADALDDLVAAAKAAGGECGDCLPLRVTEAHLATGLVETTQGPAEAPLWVFTVDGTAVRITRVAVDPSITVIPPPYNADHPPAGMSFDLAVGTPGSTKLTVSFTGAPSAGDKPCGADYTAEAVESDLAVVVIVTAHANATPASCPAVGKTRTATATLAAPLGKRAVLEVTQGLPVPVHAP